MGSSAIPVREESRHSTHLDGHPDGGVSCPHEITADRCDEVAGDGQVLSATSSTQEARATPRNAQEEEVGLQQLWFALSHQQRTRFGGHFSEMLLRVVRQQTDRT